MKRYGENVVYDRENQMLVLRGLEKGRTYRSWSMVLLDEEIQEAQCS